MWSEITGIRPGERRDVAGGVLTVVLVLSAHGALETARDALFLAKLPAAHLPWVYLAVAACGLVASRITERSSGEIHDRGALSMLQLAAALGTAGFWAISQSRDAWVFYALYVWAGVAAMVVLIRLWLVLSERFTASQAKRLFPVVSAASVAGAMLGYALAGILSRSLPVRHLIAVSAGLFLSSAGAVFVISPSGPAVQSRGRSERRELEPLRTARATLANPYALRVGSLLMLASLAVTIGDFLFKSAVARSIPVESLSTFFASVYFAFNVLSLVTSLFVTPLVRRLGVTSSLVVLPVLLVAGALGYALTAGLAAVLFLRGADGALRFSLHKTATELLYVPMPSSIRNLAKSVVEVLANRGGQVLGSLVILGWLGTSGSAAMLWLPILLAALGWIALARSLRQPYFDLFRQTLSEGSIQTRLDFPELHLASLETLIASLNAADDRKVLAAMDMLQETDRVALIPALILYHPAPRVVVRALDLFAGAKRDDFLSIAERLLDHETPAVRAAALRAWTAVRPSENVLRAARERHCAAVDATALVGLVAHGWMSPAEGLAELGRHLDTASGAHACSDVAPFVASAIRYQPSPIFTPVLERLVKASDRETRLVAVKAMGSASAPRVPPLLVSLLPDADLRREVRRALVAIGEPALDHLAEAARNETLPHAVRIHLPRSISPFRSPRAAELLLGQLRVEPSGMVRYKILRGLGRMVAENPELRLDRALLDQFIEDTLAQIFKRLHSRLALERGATEDPERRTVAHELLTELLRDKERYGVERLFRALGLRYRREDVAEIYRALAEGGSRVRSSGRELLESLLPPRLGTAVLGLIDDVPDEVRLEAGVSYQASRAADYDTVLSALLQDPSETLAALAGSHAAEVRLDSPSRERRRRGSPLRSLVTVAEPSGGATGSA